MIHCDRKYHTNIFGNKRSMSEYLMGVGEGLRLLNICIFEEALKKTAYACQTKKAIEKGVSNCSLCVADHNANSKSIYKFVEMDADRVNAWSKGSSTYNDNCQMLYMTHKRGKGSR